MIFIPQNAVKGQALAEFLAAHPVPEHSKLHEDIPIHEDIPDEVSSLI